MTKVSPLISSTNSGEFSPKMFGREGFDRYGSACSVAKNVKLLPQGGFQARPGTRKIELARLQSGINRIVPFIFSQAETYYLEFTAGRIRVIKDLSLLTVPTTNSTISNGTFTSNITGWTDNSEGTATIEHNANDLLALRNNANDAAWAEQAVSTSSTNSPHVLKFISHKNNKFYGADEHLQLRIGTSSEGGEILEATQLGLGYHSIEFTPTAATYYLQFGVLPDVNHAYAIYIDDVSIMSDEDYYVETPYTADQINELDFQQTADVLYIFHKDVPTYKLERRADRRWSCVLVPWLDGPYGEENPGTDLAARNLIRNGLFDDGFTGWEDKSNGSGNIEYDGAQQIAILRTENEGQYGAIEQVVTTQASGSTEYVIHFQIVGHMDDTNQGTEMLIGSTSGASDIFSASVYTPGWHSLGFTSSAATFYIRFRFGAGDDKSGGVGGCSLYSEKANLLQVNGSTGQVTMTASGDFAPFKSTDLGRLIRLNFPGKEPAWGVIRNFTSSSEVVIVLRRECVQYGIPTESWYLGEFSQSTGFPEGCGFFQNRLIPFRKNSMFFSQSADFENMRPDSFVSNTSQTEDNDALNYTISSKEVNNIVWAIGEKVLVIGTSGGVWVARSDGPVITASDIQIEKHAADKALASPAIGNGDTAVFIEGSGTALLDIAYNYEREGYVSADLNILADHILRDYPMQEIYYQRRPDKNVWGYRSDGVLAVLAYDRSQNIIGWSRVVMAGNFLGGNAIVESIAVKPGSYNQDFSSGERDEVCVIVKRTINGATVRTIEVFEADYELPVRNDFNSKEEHELAILEDQKDAFYVDAGVTVDIPLTITNATQANPCVVTSASHGVNDGDEVAIEAVVGMTELNLKKYIAMAVTTDTVSLCLENNSKPVLDATQANPCVITSYGHGFSNGDKIGINGVSGMTELNGNIYTIANVTADTFELSGINATGYTAFTSGSGLAYPTVDASNYSAYDNAGELRETFTTITGLSHLEGESVAIYADGKAHPKKTVSSASVTLDYSASKAHAGLSFDYKWESLPLNSGARSGTSLMKTKEVNALGILYAHAGEHEVSIKTYDNDDEDRERQHGLYNPFSQSHGLGDDIDSHVLRHGVYHQEVDNVNGRDVRVCIEGSSPNPCSVTAVSPQMETRET